MNWLRFESDIPECKYKSLPLQKYHHHHQQHIKRVGLAVTLQPYILEMRGSKSSLQGYHETFRRSTQSLQERPNSSSTGSRVYTCRHITLLM